MYFPRIVLVSTFAVSGSFSLLLLIHSYFWLVLICISTSLAKSVEVRPYDAAIVENFIFIFPLSLCIIGVPLCSKFVFLSFQLCIMMAVLNGIFKSWRTEKSCQTWLSCMKIPFNTATTTHLTCAITHHNERNNFKNSFSKKVESVFLPIWCGNRQSGIPRKKIKIKK